MRVAVVGAGVVGLSTTKALLDRGHEVTCFEAAEPMAARSVGDTRIFRILHRDATLARLAVQARGGWQRWSDEAGEQLVGNEGLLANANTHPYGKRVLAAVEAPFDIVEKTDSLAPLTSHPLDEPMLFDEWAGVIRADRTGVFLQQKCANAIKGERITDLNKLDANAIVVCAGSGTPQLIDVDISHERVARFTFEMRDSQAIPPCWFDEFGDARMWGKTVAPGQWAMGVHWPGEVVAMENSEQQTSEAVLAKLQQYIANRADQLDQNPIDVINCIADAGGDGVHFKRDGKVLAVWGDNLFKFAPALGEALATAAVSGGELQLI